MSLFQKMQQVLVILSNKSDQRTSANYFRRLMANSVLAFRTVAGVRKALLGMDEAIRFHKAETGTWVPIDEFRAGQAGPFDACDLRHWLHLAALAGVKAVPAKEILRLSEAEMSAASGEIRVPDSPGERKARKALSTFAEDELKKLDEGVVPDGPIPGQDFATMMMEMDDADPDLVERKLFDAMDDVPEGWMVRSARTGPSNLKALAGAGHAGDMTPEVRFGPNLEVGPGWVRHGNRRRVDVSDLRTVEAAVRGPDDASAFLARPWQKAARYIMTADPHRHGTQFAGKGFWPAEWRAFVEDGKVVGVSFYYSWAGEVTVDNARIALAVREEAQKIADMALSLKAWPRYMETERLRDVSHPKIRESAFIQEMLQHFGREKVACTLDFIETDEGLKLLEGGPANTPFGGGHPCGFAGCGGEPVFGNRTPTEGVAFRNMDHVLIGSPETWKDGERAGCILTFEEVDRLIGNSGEGNDK